MSPLSNSSFDDIEDPHASNLYNNLSPNISHSSSQSFLPSIATSSFVSSPLPTDLNNKSLFHFPSNLFRSKTSGSSNISPGVNIDTRSSQDDTHIASKKYHHRHKSSYHKNQPAEITEKKITLSNDVDNLYFNDNDWVSRKKGSSNEQKDYIQNQRTPDSKSKGNEERNNWQHEYEKQVGKFLEKSNLETHNNVRKSVGIDSEKYKSKIKYRDKEKGRNKKDISYTPILVCDSDSDDNSSGISWKSDEEQLLFKSRTLSEMNQPNPKINEKGYYQNKNEEKISLNQNAKSVLFRSVSKSATGPIYPLSEESQSVNVGKGRKKDDQKKNSRIFDTSEKDVLKVQETRIRKSPGIPNAQYIPIVMDYNDKNSYYTSFSLDKQPSRLSHSVDVSHGFRKGGSKSLKDNIFRRQKDQQKEWEFDEFFDHKTISSPKKQSSFREKRHRTWNSKQNKQNNESQAIESQYRYPDSVDKFDYQPNILQSFKERDDPNQQEHEFKNTVKDDAHGSRLRKKLARSISQAMKRKEQIG